MKVGDYVRTEDGHIDKIVKISDEMKSGRTIKVQIGEEDIIGGYKDFVNWFSPSHFIKSSSNIIDLIEEGDYVNEFYVINKPFNQRIHTEFDDFFEEDIESIVTKEQFESMKYKVGE